NPGFTLGEGVRRLPGKILSYPAHAGIQYAAAINSITGFSGIQGHLVPASPRLCWGWRVEAPATAASRAMTTGRAITTECEATISRRAAPEGWRQPVFPEVKRAQRRPGARCEWDSFVVRSVPSRNSCLPY